MTSRPHASSSRSKMVPFPSETSYTPVQGPVSLCELPLSDTPGALTPQYDDKGRQKRFSENAEQRRQRMEFLRRKEWTRRIAAWINQSGNGDLQDPIYSTFPWEEAAASASADHDVAGRADSSDEWDESEPYVIYTTSPRSPSSSTSSLSDPPSPAKSISRPVLPTPTVKPRSWVPHSRHSSLTSISEEDEGKYTL